MGWGRSDLWAITLAIASIIIATLSELYAVDLARALFTFLSGVFVTIFAQERLEKKRQKRNRQIEMTKHIYGSLHKELTSMLIDLKGFQWPDVASFDDIMKDYRFSFDKGKIRNRIEELKKRLPLYIALLSDAHREIENYIKKRLSKFEVKWQVNFEIWIAGRRDQMHSLTDPIFRDRDPLDYLIEKASSYENAHIYVNVNGKSKEDFSKEHIIHKISMKILEEVRKNPLIVKQRAEKEYLINECNSLRKMIEKEIVL